MVNFFYHWWMGYVVLTLRGNNIEEFINFAIQAHLEIWDIERIDHEQIKLKIRLKHFFRLKSILRRTGTQLHIIEKMGFPFLLRSLYRRKGLIIGVCLFFFLLYMLSSIIWKIEVTGTENISEEFVLKVAQEIGLKSGAFKRNFKDLQLVQKQLQDRIEDASWVGIRIDGVVVNIMIVEKVKPNHVQDDRPRHLIAKKKAIVQKYTAEAGKPKITRYQLVNPGDILISGIIGDETNPTKQQQVAAKGEVWGETWYDSTISIPLKQEYNRITGDFLTNYYLILGKWKIKVWGFDQTEENTMYKREYDKSYLAFFDFQLPIGLEKEKSHRLEKEIITRSEQEAIALALDMARKKLIKDLGDGATIKNEKVLQQWVENDKVYIKVHYVVLEEITKEQPIIPTS